MLKVAEQFESAFMQLAYAYRFKLIGVNNLSFEPEADNGRKADLYFEYKEVKYLVECFRPSTKNDLGYNILFKKTAEECFTKINNANKRNIIFIKLKNNFNQGIRKYIEYELNRLLPYNEEKIILEKENFIIEISNTSTTNDSDEDKIFRDYYERSTCGLNTSWINKGDEEKIRRGIQIKSRTGSRFLVKLPEEEFDFDKGIEKLCSKVEKKVAQTKRSDLEGKVRGIILLGSPIANDQAWGLEEYQSRLDLFVD